MAPRCIEPARSPVDAEFDAVPSKSVTHRALVAAALGAGESAIVGPLDADDTRRTREGLRQLGIAVDAGGDAWTVRGAGGRVRGGGTLDLGASGTSARFLAALAALGRSPSRLDGTARLRERPMQELVTALEGLGAVVRASEGGRLPLVAGGGEGVAGGAAELPGARSSQFASALLLAAPAFRDGLELTLRPPLVSLPYVAMTVAVLAGFGVIVHRAGLTAFRVPPQAVRPTRWVVEGDHSAASYLVAAAAITGGSVRLRGLARRSLQPDARFLADLESIGCRVTDEGGAVVVRGAGRIPAFDWDLRDAPDLAPAACVLALFAEGPCRLTGVSHLRLKESDRLAALADGAARAGARARAGGDELVVEPAPGGRLAAASIDVAGDHRIAMAFAVAGLRGEGLTLSDDGPVAKSYPGFWDDFERLSGRAG